METAKLEEPGLHEQHPLTHGFGATMGYQCYCLLDVSLGGFSVQGV